MATLAKRFLHSEEYYSNHDPQLKLAQEWAYKFVAQRLAVPLRTDANPERSAERFVFDIDAPEFVQDLIDAGSIPRDVIRQSVSLPNAPVWIEYPCNFDNGDKGHFGIMIDTMGMSETTIHKPSITMAVIGASSNSPAVPLCLAAFDSFPALGQTNMLPVFFMDDMGEDMGSTGIDAILNYCREIEACLWLLQTPRIVELQKAAFGPRKAKVRKENGKPFVEVHRVKMRIGLPEKRYESSGAGAGTGSGEGGKKYHRVMPHFRTYGRKEGKPRAKLVESFWRGDPKKGIIIHERSVTVGPNLPPRED